MEMSPTGGDKWLSEFDQYKLIETFLLICWYFLSLNNPLLSPFAPLSKPPVIVNDSKPSVRGGWSHLEQKDENNNPATFNGIDKCGFIKPNPFSSSRYHLLSTWLILHKPTFPFLIFFSFLLF